VFIPRPSFRFFQRKNLSASRQHLLFFLLQHLGILSTFWTMSSHVAVALHSAVLATYCNLLNDSFCKWLRCRLQNMNCCSTWLQSSSIQGLITPWIVVLHWFLLSVTLSILFKWMSVHWMMLFNPSCLWFSSFLIRFLRWYPILNNCVWWCDQNSIISLSLRMLTKFFLLQLFQNPFVGFSCCPWHP